MFKCCWNLSILPITSGLFTNKIEIDSTETLKGSSKTNLENNHRNNNQSKHKHHLRLTAGYVKFQSKHTSSKKMTVLFQPPNGVMVVLMALRPQVTSLDLSHAYKLLSTVPMRMQSGFHGRFMVRCLLQTKVGYVCRRFSF